MSCFIPTVPPSLASHVTPTTSNCRSTLNRGSFVPKRRRVTLSDTTTQQRSPQMNMDASAAVTSLLLSGFSDVNKSSLFATAFVFFLTVWGSVSFVKGSTKTRITQASFTLREPSSELAKKTARYFMERSFEPDLEKDPRPGVMTFTGKVRASTSIASILVAVVGSGTWAVTYILNFILPENLQSPYWGLLTFLSVLIVPWYWKQAARTEEVRLMIEEEDGVSTVFVKGHRDELLDMEGAFQWKRNEPVYEGDEKAKQPETASTN